MTSGEEVDRKLSFCTAWVPTKNYGRSRSYTFAQKRRAVSLDYPGYGESDLVSGRLTRQQIAEHVLKALDALGVEAPHIVGLSMGGVIALEICRQQAKRVRSLTIADSFAYHPEGEAILERSLGALLTMSMRQFAEMRVPCSITHGYA
ncbi:MAG: alpha/beta fold hydrolase [Pyrinomonadaceae bacterium]